LFALVLFGGALLTWIPVAVLAAVLMMGGVAMVKQSTLKLLRAAWSAQHRDARTLATPALALIVAATLFFGSVPMALLMGAMLAMLLLAFELSAATRFTVEPLMRAASRRVWPAAQAKWLLENSGAIAVFRPEGALFFGTADRLGQQLKSPPAGTRFCVLDLARVTTVDATACEIIVSGARALVAAGITPLVAGVNATDPRGRSLIALGLVFPDPRTCWFADTDHAIEHAETQMLRTVWPAVDAPAPFSFSDTPLTTGLNDAQLRELHAVMRPVQSDPGLLFQYGDPGSSMFILESGRVEIRVSGGHQENHVRLAAFAEGSIFGELSLLMDQPRTADAICTAPTRLLKLDRAAMDHLEANSPQLFAAIMRNLSLHIARRLDAATGLVRSLH
ncbi:MAG: cyclic nucleotide-binding domain-containing protein, partial [Variovorax sp.]